MKASLKAFSINSDTWEEAATDRLGWRPLTHKGAVDCEEKRTLVAEERCDVQVEHEDIMID